MRDLDKAKILAAILKTLRAIDPSIADDFKKNLSSLSIDELGEALEIIRKVRDKDARRSSKEWTRLEAEEEMKDNPPPDFE